MLILLQFPVFELLLPSQVLSQFLFVPVPFFHKGSLDVRDQLSEEVQLDLSSAGKLQSLRFFKDQFSLNSQFSEQIAFLKFVSVLREVRRAFNHESHSEIALNSNSCFGFSLAVFIEVFEFQIEFSLSKPFSD